VYIIVSISGYILITINPKIVNIDKQKQVISIGLKTSISFANDIQNRVIKKNKYCFEKSRSNVSPDNIPHPTETILINRRHARIFNEIAFGFP